MTLEERRRRYEQLPRRSRELVSALIRLAHLPIVDVARTLQMGEANARKRLRAIYAADALDCESRTHLVSVYRDVVDADDDRRDTVDKTTTTP